MPMASSSEIGRKSIYCDIKLRRENENFTEHCHAEPIRCTQGNFREASGRFLAERERPFAALRSSALNAREWGDTEGKHERDAIAQQPCPT